MFHFLKIKNKYVIFFYTGTWISINNNSRYERVGVSIVVLQNRSSIGALNMMKKRSIFQLKFAIIGRTHFKCFPYLFDILNKFKEKHHLGEFKKCLFYLK